MFPFTGEFSTRLAGIGEYNSLPIEMVTIVLMLIGTTNFAVLMLLLIFIPVTALPLANGTDMGVFESLRQSAFNLASALSTTGYSTVDYFAGLRFVIRSLRNEKE